MPPMLRGHWWIHCRIGVCRHRVGGERVGGKGGARRSARLQMQLHYGRNTVKLPGLRHGVNSTRSVDESSRRGRLRVALAASSGGDAAGAGAGARGPRPVVRGQPRHRRRGPRRRDQHDGVQLVRPRLRLPLARPRREALLRRRRIPARRHPAARALPAKRVSRSRGRYQRRPEAAERLRHLPHRRGPADGGGHPRHHRPRLAAGMAPTHRDARPAASGGGSLQPLSHAGERRLDRAAAARSRLPLRHRVLGIRGGSGATGGPGEPRGGSEQAGRHRRRGRRRCPADRYFPGARPDGLPLGPALFPGRAAAQPAEPLQVRPLPLRHRQHRLGELSARRGHGAPDGRRQREPPAPYPRQSWLRHGGLLPRRPRVDLAQLSRQQRAGARPHQPGLQGRGR